MKASAIFLIAMVTYGKESDTPISPFSSAVLNPFLVWRLVGTISISLMHRCYGNLVFIATRLKHQ